jgi:hypothetical protein
MSRPSPNNGGGGIDDGETLFRIGEGSEMV